ncbi:MAG: DUF2293 domain-containing protein [Deltaproteobacteria bacterium]|nr:DUF2293 domain-containing protein [Deltaproteobacteria bacterium]
MWVGSCGNQLRIAEHACRKHSGRVGRSAVAKEFDSGAIELAVRAAVRHSRTPYDQLLAAGRDRHEARTEVAGTVDAVLRLWEAGGGASSTARGKPLAITGCCRSGRFFRGPGQVFGLFVHMMGPKGAGRSPGPGGATGHGRESHGPSGRQNGGRASASRGERVWANRPGRRGTGAGRVLGQGVGPLVGMSVEQRLPRGGRFRWGVFPVRAGRLPSRRFGGRVRGRRREFRGDVVVRAAAGDCGRRAGDDR